MKRNRIIYLVALGLVSLLMLMAAGMYIFNHEEVSATFTKLGYPTYIIYPLAIAKLLGLVAIWSNKSAWLKEWAYAGFVFDFLLAASAHIAISDGEHWAAIAALILIFVAYFMEDKKQ